MISFVLCWWECGCCGLGFCLTGICLAVVAIVFLVVFPVLFLLLLVLVLLVLLVLRVLVVLLLVPGGVTHRHVDECVRPSLFLVLAEMVSRAVSRIFCKVKVILCLWIHRSWIHRTKKAGNTRWIAW